MGYLIALLVVVLAFLGAPVFTLIGAGSIYLFAGAQIDSSAVIVEMLRLAGAREVHMMISSPPVKFPCYFGIDTPSHEELIGAKKSVEEIRKVIGADSLNYLTVEDLLKTVEGAGCNFCVGCFSGEYPVDIEKANKETESMNLSADE